MADLPSGTVTFLFTDIEGSTNLAQLHPSSWEASRQRHDAVLREAFETHQGYVFQISGDAFCAAFATAPDALAAAISAQRALQAEVWRDAPIRVRMGLHTGAAGAREGDYHGYLTLVRVQRVMSAAYGGQVLLSGTSAELVRGNLPEPITLRDLGEHRLKGLLNPEHLWQVVVPDLPQDFPPLQSLNAIPNNLPMQLTSFIGREKELAELKRLLPTTRLLTLIGSGGVGKTRLSLQLAAEVLDTYKDGVWFIELAPLADPALIPGLIVSTIGPKEQPGQSLHALLSDYFHTRKALLILDNCEHLIAECATIGYTLLRSAPGLAILASSREALGIAGELAWRVASLQIPNPAQAAHMPLAELTQYEAVRLFIERAKFAQPAFAVSDANAPAVAQICYRLDGIPLAIELAAARIKLFPAEQIASHLDDRFRLLTSGSRNALPRQQTLRALIDWSYSLLSEPERILLRQLAVFAGGWSLEAAQAVCAGAAVDEYELIDLLAHLVDKSLVVAEERTGSARYRMLETIRQYAQEKSDEAGKTKLARDRHLRFFLNLAEEAEPKLRGPGQVEWLDQLETERENVRAALGWAIQTEQTEAALSMAANVSRFWIMHSQLTEGRRWLERALAQPAASRYPRAQASALLPAGILAWLQRRNEEARFWLEQCLQVAQAHGDKLNVAHALDFLGMVAAVDRDYATAYDNLETSRALFQELGHGWGLAQAIFHRGWVALEAGDSTTAIPLCEQALALYRELGDRHRQSILLRMLGTYLARQGDRTRGVLLLREGLTLAQQVGSRHEAVNNLARFALDVESDPARQATMLQAVVSISQRLGSLWFTEQSLGDELAKLREQLDAAAYSKAVARGAAMTIDQAIEFALGEPHG